MQVIKNNKAESIVWIIIWIIILSIMLLWIIKVIDFSKDSYSTYEEYFYKHIITWNSNNIIKKLDVSNIWDDETFYLYKDTITKNFTILTWSSNENYSYINKLWTDINKNLNIWKTYKREFLNKIDVLRYNINPSYLSWVIFHFDSTNIDWTYNSTLNDNDEISLWKDLINNYNASQNTAGLKPIYKLLWINSFPYIKFDWSNDILNISNNIDINTASSYPEKSFAIVLKTWSDVISSQTIYEQWWWSEWYEFKINSADISARIWNSSWDKTVNLWEAIINSIYFITIIQDSNNGKLQIYINWELVNEQTGLSSSQVLHSWNITIWNNWFSWWLWELISWNHALTENEIRWIQIYFSEKWLRWKQDVIHYVIENQVNKVKN